MKMMADMVGLWKMIFTRENVVEMFDRLPWLFTSVHGKLVAQNCLVVFACKVEIIHPSHSGNYYISGTITQVY